MATTALVCVLAAVLTCAAAERGVMHFAPHAAANEDLSSSGPGDWYPTGMQQQDVEHRQFHPKLKGHNFMHVEHGNKPVATTFESSHGRASMLKPAGNESLMFVGLAAECNNGFYKFKTEWFFSYTCKSKDAIMAELRKKPRALEYAPKELQQDREVVMLAVQSDKWTPLDGMIRIAAGAFGVGNTRRPALLYASEDLRANKQVVLAAVKSNFVALQVASKELRADKEIVLAAVSGDRGWAMQFASKELLADRAFVLEAVKLSARALMYAPAELLARREFVLEAVRVNALSLRYASEEMRGDRQIVLAAVRRDGRAAALAGAPRGGGVAGWWNDEGFIHQLRLQADLDSPVFVAATSFCMAVFGNNNTSPPKQKSGKSRVPDKAACLDRVALQNWTKRSHAHLCHEVCEELVHELQLQEDSIDDAYAQKWSFREILGNLPPSLSGASLATICVEKAVRTVESRTLGCCGAWCGWSADTRRCVRAPLMEKDEVDEMFQECCTEQQVVEGSDRYRMCQSLIPALDEDRAMTSEENPKPREEDNGVPNDELLGESFESPKGASLLQSHRVDDVVYCTPNNFKQCMKNKVSTRSCQVGKWRATSNPLVNKKCAPVSCPGKFAVDGLCQKPAGCLVQVQKPWTNVQGQTRDLEAVVVPSGSKWECYACKEYEGRQETLGRSSLGVGVNMGVPNEANEVFTQKAK